MPQIQPVFEPTMAELPAIKPWERMEGEPARWFLRFRNYLKMGPRRTVNAVFERERQEKAGKATNKAGSRWYNAALHWQWEARAEAYDTHIDEGKAAALRQVAASMPFVSRPYRLVHLNMLAEGLMRRTTDEGLDLPEHIACIRTMQALMHDIAEEVQAWGIPLDHTADSAALLALAKRYLISEDLE